jgi:hypothetical protein
MESGIRYVDEYAAHRFRSFIFSSLALRFADMAASCWGESSWALDEVETSSACSILLAL